jgi:lysophospholipase L1-like esterase
VYNGAIAGSKIEDQLSRFEKLYPVRPDLMMIGHGLNYEADSPTVFLASIQAFVDKLLAVYPGTPIAIISQNPRYPADGVPASRIPDHEARQKAIASYASARQWLFIDTFAAFEKLPDGGLGYTTDDKHPNAAGRAVQVACVREALSSIGTGNPGSSAGVRLEQVPNFPYRLRIQS